MSVSDLASWAQCRPLKWGIPATQDALMCSHEDYFNAILSSQHFTSIFLISSLSEWMWEFGKAVCVWEWFILQDRHWQESLLTAPVMSQMNSVGLHVTIHRFCACILFRFGGLKTIIVFLWWALLFYVSNRSLTFKIWPVWFISLICRKGNSVISYFGHSSDPGILSISYGNALKC